MKRVFQLLSLCLVCLVVAACGEKSQESVVKELNKTWVNTNYELSATMEIKDGQEPRLYDVVVWHTKPSFYRVEMKERDSENAQIILKNDDGVFLVSPSTQKTYKFQTDWPKKNSQAYLISTLAEDIAADKSAAMEQTEKHYVFEAATRNHDKTGLPTQQITIDKKTMLPSKVALLDTNLSEKVVITFNKVNLKVKHKPEEYIITESTSSQTAQLPPFKVFYPSIDLENTHLIDEVVIREQGKERAVLSYEGDKSFTLIQMPTNQSDKIVSVFSQGSPEWVGSSYGAMYENTLSWDQDGVSFLLTSNELTSQEMLQLAASLSEEGLK